MSDRQAVDINTFTADELNAVPALKGHGYEIVRYREERGGFTDLRKRDEVFGMRGKADGLNAALTVGER